MEIGGERLVVEEAAPESFAGVDLAFFMAGGAVSKRFAQAARSGGSCH
jgi:aspartate-semialdehyde dehydrogenase